MIQIRKMELIELPQVLKLHLAGLEHEMSFLNKIIPGRRIKSEEVERIAQIFSQALRSGEGQIFIAKDQKDYVGYCYVVRKFYPIEEPQICGCINGVYVKEIYRGQGIAKKLVEKSFDWLREHHVTYVELNHMINEEGTTAFWKKLGFEPIQLMCAKKI